MRTCDFLVVGGGIIGLCVARELRLRYPKEHIIVLEKEQRVGLHSSGRNSGVIHAGFYYSADSLKARFTRQGNISLTQYCEEKNLPLNRCGKLVVARGEGDLPYLKELLERGKVNQVPLELISAEDARKIEPRVKTYEKAIWSPSTKTTDPKILIEKLREDITAMGISIETSNSYRAFRNHELTADRDVYSPGYLVNAAGLYADQIALDFGFSQDYRILPFKGLYLYSSEPAWSLRTNVYPVPDLRNPFLGVHFTLTADGTTKIGPTAIPAFWREQYTGLERFKVSEFIEILLRESGLLFSSGFDFKRLAIEEIQKYRRKRLVELASHLLEGVDLRHYQHWGKPGIRAQLLNIKKRKLEMDFVLEGDNRSLHILNAVSPGWTCAFPFSKHICDRIDDLIKEK